MNGHIAVLGLLTRSTTLATLVGTRIYPDIMPDVPVLPAITYQKLSGSSEKGAVVDPALMTATFQVSSWAKSRSDASILTGQVRAAMDRMRKVTIGGVAIDDCLYQDDMDLFDPETRTFFNHCTFKIYYRDAA